MKKNEMKYYYKVISSGDVTEVYAYQYAQYKELSLDDLLDEAMLNEELEKEEKKQDEISLQEKSIIQKESKDEKEYVRRKRDIMVTKRKLRRLVSANVGQHRHTDKFVTLTFEGEPPTREKVCKKFRYFKERMYKKYGKFEYLAVIEIGAENGRLHIHMITFGLKYIDRNELEKIWGNGFIDVKKIYEINDVENYILKYIEKTLSGDYIGKGQRFYFPSQGLKKPIETLYEDDDFLFDDELGNCECDVEFKSEHIVGKVVYQRYRRVNYDWYED